jgi:hypothetical protein
LLSAEAEDEISFNDDNFLAGSAAPGSVASSRQAQDFTKIKVSFAAQAAVVAKLVYQEEQGQTVFNFNL